MAESSSSDIQISDGEITKALDSLLIKAKRKKIGLGLLNSSFLVVFIVMLPQTQTLSTLATSLLAVAIILVTLLLISRSPSYRAVNRSNLLEHINRELADYEESAQLALTDLSQLSLLQKIQQQKVRQKLAHDIRTHRLAAHLPKLNFRSTFILIVFLLPLALFINFILPQIQFGEVLNINSSPSDVLESSLVSPAIESANIVITPPVYTKLKTQQLTSLDLKIPEGSTVNWQFELSRADLDYFYIGADKQRIPLSKNSQDRFELELLVSQTTIYRLVYQDVDGFHNLPGVYSIEVIRDLPPKIKILSPKQSLVEIPKSGEPEFKIESLISDDYGVAEVSILASVAKGSGEAVKFRDEEFKFDSVAKTEKGNRYQKHWKLTDLKMEPGDEVYFSIVATDNKEPNAQQGKSSSVIVRWLDDEIVETAAEGIQIRFVPEYFRSQRQIIIETEELIADKKDLSVEDFTAKSTDLGHSQRDLKEKYGQYLGDEFGEGPGEQFGLADGYHGGEDIASGEASAGLEGDDDHTSDDHGSDDHEEGGHRERPQVGHSHETVSESGMTNSNDLSGASELIAQFAHNHGSVEVGPMSRRDPKSWMKKAVSIMWQAELHLMMSEPEKALPFEYEAYEYLKLARQADRVYVKRLGFEPPPVKESNRLTGELKDILTYEVSVEDSADTTADSHLFKQVHQLMNTWPLSEKIKRVHLHQLSNLRERLLTLAETRPVLIKYAATIERVLIAESLDIENCDNCIAQLQQKLWQLMPSAKSLPRVGHKRHIIDNTALEAYLEKRDSLNQRSSGKEQGQ